MFQGNLAETLNWCHLILWLGYTTVLPLILCLSMDMLKFMMPYLSNYQHTGWKDVESEILFCLHLNMSKNKNPHPSPLPPKTPNLPTPFIEQPVPGNPQRFCLFVLEPSYGRNLELGRSMIGWLVDRFTRYEFCGEPWPHIRESHDAVSSSL